MSWYPLQYYSSSGPTPPGPTPGENYITEIQIKKMPQQYYPNNRQIDLGDIRVDAIYNNGFSTNVTKDCGFIPADSSLIQSSDTVNLNTSYICTDGIFYATEIPLYAVDQDSYNFAYNVSNNIISCSNLFNGCKNFNKPVVIGKNVANCEFMFRNCSIFDQPITIPNNVIDAHGMFLWCSSYNQPITIDAQNCYEILGSCNNFDSQVIIGDNVINCSYMFSSCINFNQPISIPDNVIDCDGMLYHCYNFNSPVIIGNNVTNCRSMFSRCFNFDLPINIPDNVTDASYMLSECSNFNSQVIIGNNVTNCAYMFYTISNMCQNIYIKSTNITDISAMLVYHNKQKQINLFCTDLSLLNKTTYGSSLVRNAITWESMTNGYYNTEYNIYLYNNMPSEIF